MNSHKIAPAMMIQRKTFGLLLSFAFVGGIGFLAAMRSLPVLAAEQAAGSPGRQAGLTPQLMQNPIPLQPKGINILLAPDAMRSPNIGEFGPQSNFKAKRFWLTGWKSPDQEIAWNVTAAEAGNYRLAFLIHCPKGKKIKVSAGNASFVFTSQEGGWQRQEAERTLRLPAGGSVVRLRIVEADDRAVELKSVELLNVKDKAGLERRVQAFKGEASWMKDAGYGVMVQCGGWSYPPQGEKKPWPGFAEDFDAKKFVRQVDEMGGKFVVWSATWIDFLFPAPIESLGEILPNRVSRRDLLGDLIKECRDRRIRFMLYYHLGHGQRDVLLAKGWKNSDEQDFASRQKWLAREEKILREIGLRYGKGLDGVFLDDGCTWYPADFEKLGAAIKAGNPKRIITYNPWMAPSLTPFQDFYCGEGFSGKYTPCPLRDGVIARGPYAGLQLWGNFVFDGPNWGIHLPNTKINPPEHWTVDQIVQVARRLEKERFSVAFDLLMYENGEFGPESYNMLKAAAQKLGRGPWGQLGRRQEGNRR